MTIRLKAVTLGLGVGLATAAMAQPAQQQPYQGQVSTMGQMGQGTGQMGQGMGPAQPMMNDPRMQAQMSQMAQGCGHMMSIMVDRMRRPDTNRR